MEDFVSNVPSIAFGNPFHRRWFPETTHTVGLAVHRGDVVVEFNQRPAITGIGSFRIQGKIARPLSFLDGKAVLEILLTDHFGFGRKLRIYHDGHSGATLGLQHSARFNSVVGVSFDGVRVRFLYKPNRIRLQTATVYQSNPKSLYSLSTPKHDEGTNLVGPLRPDFVLEVHPNREFESDMLGLGSAYDHGTIGAEVAFSIASEMLMNDHLLIMEPAMKGSDIISRDRSVAIEARMLAGSRARTPSYIQHEVVPHFKQMLGRLRWGLSQKAFKRGIAILCLRLEDRRILVCVKEA
ncbi:MAG: hypothetical protein JRM74_04455 [Nitrososphaerota archaeon]|nr:hypothetical protein [Nitrososphaerota archaeon]